MDRIKILYIITGFDLGGAQKSLLSVLSHLPKDKYDIFLACADRGILLTDALNIPNIQVKLFSSLRREIKPVCDLKALIELRAFIKQVKPDIVHTHSSKAGIIGRWAAKLAGIPVIMHTIHGWEFHPWQNPLIKKFYIFLEKITATITHRLIAVTNYDIRYGLNSGIGNHKKYALIRYGIRRKDFASVALGSSLVVGMVVCFKPQKSPLDFIRAAALVREILPEAKFLIAGDGILRSKIERLIRELNLSKNVTLLGWRRDIPELMQLFDILVLTSRWEGLPVVFLEAMAAGKPIIATDICGNSEIIKDGKNGFLIPPGDYTALSQKIILLLKDKNLRERLGRAGQQLLDDSFEVDYMVKRLEEIYA